MDGFTKFLIGLAIGYVLRGLADNVQELRTPTLAR